MSPNYIVCISYDKYISSHYPSLTSPYRYIYVTHAARALQSHDLSGERIKLWITYTLFWPHKNMEGLPGWVISPMPGPPPRQHKHERQYTWSTHCHPNKANMEWWLRRPNDTRWPCGLKFPDICLTGEEKPHPGNLYRPGIEPGPAAWQARMLPLAPQRWTMINTIYNN